MFAWATAGPATTQNGGSAEARQKLNSLLVDDQAQILSSFELNQIASLTYGEEVCEQVFEELEQVVKKYLYHSPLTLQKALVVTHHLLLYGAARVVNYSRAHVGPSLEALLKYNTVLLAQQQTGTMTGFLYQLKGGGVDKGGPVREAAERVHALLIDENRLRQERARHADPDSLVPVGKTNDVAFVTDEIRLAALQRKIEKQRTIEIRSNLAKADNGFGGGYNAANGQHVVGAAHTLEEMMVHARRADQKFSDDGTGQGYTAPALGLDFAVPSPPRHSAAASGASEPVADLLTLNSPAASAVSEPVADLLALDYHHAQADGGVRAGTMAQTDLLDFAAATVQHLAPPVALDPFAVHAPPRQMTSSAATSTDIWGSMSLQPAIAGMSHGNSGIGSGTLPHTAGSTIAQANSSVPVGDDRFAALDALVSGAGGQPSSFTTSSTAPTTYGRPTPMANKSAFADLAAPGFGMTAVLPSTAPATQTLGSLSSLRVSAQPVATELYNNENESENGFVMGGATGAGLEPAAPAPWAPPPPPPPSSSSTGYW